MRNKYTKEFEDFVKSKSSKLTKLELIKEIEKVFGITLTKSTFEKYLYRHNIKCKDYNSKMKRDMIKVPIGYEYVRPDGMVLIKVANPNKWDYKQRVLYEKYHNVKLTSDDYIIFLNQDRTDFDYDNLYMVSRRESSIMANQKMFTKNPELTKLGVNTSKLIIKIKDVEIE